MELKGKVKKIKEVEEIKDFQKRDVIVTIDYDAEYPRDIKFELHGEKVIVADTLTVGDIVKVAFNISAKYYEPKDEYYNTVRAWKIDVIEKATPKAPVLGEFGNVKSDDIPF